MRGKYEDDVHVSTGVSCGSSLYRNKKPSLSLSLVGDPCASQALVGLRLPRIQSTTMKRWTA